MSSKNVKNRYRTVKAGERLFAILELLEEMDGARVSELAERTGLAKSTVHRYLVTMLECEYLVKEGDTYQIGLRVLELGESVKNRKEAYTLGKEKVRTLAQETNERVQFIVEEHGYAVYLHREFGSQAVRTDPGIGKRVPIHATSAGKAILANLPDAQVDSVIERRGLPTLTEHTIVDPDVLWEELKEIRERGYAINDQENINGLRAIGVPVIGPSGQVVGALSVSGPTHRMQGDWFNNELPSLLLGAANEIELNLAYG